MKYLKRATLGLSFFIALLCLFGCSPEIEDEYRGLIIDCTDFRDGEKFSFNTDTIRDIEKNWSGVTGFRITTLDGKDKFLKSEMELYIKCERRT